MSATVVTAQGCNRATMARQLLLGRADVPVEEAVRRVVALQAQEPASPYLALWNRVADLDADDVDAAFAHGSLVKATLLRITLHAVHRADHADLHLAMQPTLRAARLNDRRYRDTGRTPADADGIVADLLAWLDEPRTNQEVEAWLAAQGLDEPRVWWALRHYAPVRHAVLDDEPWSFGRRPGYVTAGVPVPEPGDRAAADRALGRVVLRYLEGFGPASVADVGQFALVQRGRVRDALATLDDGAVLRLEGPDGVELLDVPDGARPAPDTPVPPRLLGMWDSILFAYHDRTRVVDDEVRAHVIRRNGDTLPSVLVDGRVVGVWRPVDDGIEVTALQPVADEDWSVLDDEAVALRDFLADREPDAFGRYGRWWDRLPDDRTTEVLGRD